LITIDVEDWFQVENFREFVPFSSWPSYEFRVERNTHRLLDLLDSLRGEIVFGSEEVGNVRATFFMLGWIATQLPHLVREIHDRGHEVASHGYLHRMCSQMSIEDLANDLSKSRKVLEDIIGDSVSGYRAPSFSINNGLLRIVKESGYLYDSSFNSFQMNARYGHVDLPSKGEGGAAYEIAKDFYEIPISNIKAGPCVLPWGGGGYFRLIPLFFFKLGVRSILKKGGCYVFYTHPWEIDPDQPRVSDAPFFFRFRHYFGLKKSEIKLESLLQSFKTCRFLNCSQYLGELIGEQPFSERAPSAGCS